MEAQEVPRLGLSEAIVAMEEEQSELDKILELLLDPKNIQHNTELNRAEITAFSVLATVAERHHKHLPVLVRYLKENLVLRVSKDRKGRTEWVKILQTARIKEDDEEDDGKVSRFFGRRRR